MTKNMEVYEPKDWKETWTKHKEGLKKKKSIE